MRIIRADNFDRENHLSDEYVVAIVNELWGKRITELLNNSEPKDSEDYFKCVEDDYKLRKFEP